MRTPLMGEPSAHASFLGISHALPPGISEPSAVNFPGRYLVGDPLRRQIDS